MVVVAVRGLKVHWFVWLLSQSNQQLNTRALTHCALHDLSMPPMQLEADWQRCLELTIHWVCLKDKVTPTFQSYPSMMQILRAPWDTMPPASHTWQYWLDQPSLSMVLGVKLNRGHRREEVPPTSIVLGVIKLSRAHRKREVSLLGGVIDNLHNKKIQSPFFAIALIIYSSICSFIYFFLWCLKKVTSYWSVPYLFPVLMAQHWGSTSFWLLSSPFSLSFSFFFLYLSHFHFLILHTLLFPIFLPPVFLFDPFWHQVSFFHSICFLLFFFYVLLPQLLHLVLHSFECLVKHLYGFFLILLTSPVGTVHTVHTVHTYWVGGHSRM